MFKSRKMVLFYAVILSTVLMIQPVFAAGYTVASGDTLNKIGSLYNTTASAIRESNNLSSDMIYPGQVLNVPTPVYTVKSGDNLYLIAQKNNISLYSLRIANNIWDNYIYPGQKLALPGAATTSGIIPYSASDLDLLARLITAEADNQPYNAKVGVGAVVINRVKSSNFPDSISEVIYQKDSRFYQFTPVENGWINRPASSDAKKAAYAALHGSDTSLGAVFYFDDSATNKWLWARSISAQIGRMVFTL